MNYEKHKSQLTTEEIIERYHIDIPVGYELNTGDTPLENLRAIPYGQRKVSAPIELGEGRYGSPSTVIVPEGYILIRKKKEPDYITRLRATGYKCGRADHGWKPKDRNIV